MELSDKKVFLVFIKLTGLLFISFVVMNYAPGYAHLLLLIIAAVLIVLGFGSLLKYKEQDNWIESKAKIKSVNEDEEKVAIPEYSKLRYFYPEIEYEYSVNGNTYTGKVVSFEKENIWIPEFDDWGVHTPKEKRWWLTINPGDNLPVFVNPRNESDAVLIKNVSNERRSHHLALFVSGILVVILWFFIPK